MSEIEIKWEFFLARVVPPCRGTVMVDEDTPNSEIDLIVEEAVLEQIASRITWEKKA